MCQGLWPCVLQQSVLQPRQRILQETQRILLPAINTTHTPVLYAEEKGLHVLRTGFGPKYVWSVWIKENHFATNQSCYIHPSVGNKVFGFSTFRHKMFPAGG